MAQDLQSRIDALKQSGLRFADDKKKSNVSDYEARIKALEDSGLVFAEEPDAGDYAAEIPKQFLRGALEGGAEMLAGASNLVDKINPWADFHDYSTESILARYGLEDFVKRSLAPNSGIAAGRAGAFLTQKLPGFMGGLVPLGLATVAGGGVGGAAAGGGEGVTGALTALQGAKAGAKVAGMVAGGIQGAQGQHEAAKAAGASPGEDLAATLGGGAIGTAAMLGPGGALTRMGAKAPLLREALGGGLVMGAQDVASQALAKGTYAPSKEIDLGQALEATALGAAGGGLVGTAEHIRQTKEALAKRSLPSGAPAVSRPAGEAAPDQVQLAEESLPFFEQARKKARAPNAEAVAPRAGRQAELDAKARELGTEVIWMRHPEDKPLAISGETSKDGKRVIMDSNMSDQEATAILIGHEFSHVLETRSPEAAAEFRSLVSKHAPEAEAFYKKMFESRLRGAMADHAQALAEMKAAAKELSEARKNGATIDQIEVLRSKLEAAKTKTEAEWARSPQLTEQHLKTLEGSEVPAYMKEDLGVFLYLGMHRRDVLTRMVTKNYGTWTKITDAIKQTLRSFGLSKALTAYEKDMKSFEDDGAKIPYGMSMETAARLVDKTIDHLETLLVPEGERPSPAQRIERTSVEAELARAEADNEQYLEALRQSGADDAEIRKERAQYEKDALERRQNVLASMAERQQVGTLVSRHHEQVAVMRAREEAEAKQHPEMPVPELKGAQDEGRKAIKAGESARKKASEDKQKSLNELERDIQKKGARSTEGGRFSLKRNPQEDTPEFKKWFGGSKVVDEDGRPLVLYHETAGEKASAIGTAGFNTSKVGARGTDEEMPNGVFLKRSGRSIGVGGETEAQMPVFAKIERPLIVEDRAQLRRFLDRDEIYRVAARAMRDYDAARGREFDARWNELREPGERAAKKSDDFMDWSDPFMETWKAENRRLAGIARERATQIIRDAGYDGLWMKSDAGSFGRKIETVVAFDPTQVKSATGNNGQFDPKNPDIRYSLPRLDAAALERIKQTTQDALEDPQVREDFPVRTPSDDHVGEAFDIGVGTEQRRRLEVVPREHMAAQAQAELEHDRAGTEAKIREAVDNGVPLDGWQHIALREISRGRTRDMIANPTKQNIREAIRWGWRDRAAGTEWGRAGAARSYLPDQTGIDAIRAAVVEPSRYLKEKMRKMQERIDRELDPLKKANAKREMQKLQDEAADEVRYALAKLEQRGMPLDMLSKNQAADPWVQYYAGRTIAEAKTRGAEKAWNWLMQWRMAAMLSAPTTHLRNVGGNTAHLLYEGPAKKIAEAAVNAVTLNRDKNAATAGEVASYLGAWLPGLAQAARNFVAAIRTDAPYFEESLKQRRLIHGDTRSRPEMEGHQNIGGKLGRAVRLMSLTMLTAEDEFFKTLSAHTEAVALAHRRTGGDRAAMDRMLQDPDSGVWDQALEHARKVTFQDKPDRESEPIAAATLGFINGVREKAHIGPVKPGYLLLPFTSTPFRIMQRGLAVPFHPVTMTVKALNGEYRNRPGSLTRDTGTLLLATGIGLAVANAVMKKDEEGEDGMPYLTGSRPWNSAEAAFQKRTAPAHSVRVGNDYYDFGGFDPGATSVAAIVDAAEAYRLAALSGDDDATAKAFQKLVSSSMDMTKDKTFLKTLGDVLEALRNPEGSKVARITRDTLVTPMVPNIVRRALAAKREQMTTDNVRQHEDEGSWMSMLRSIPDAVLPTIAGKPPELDYDTYGEPIKANSRSGLARFLSPAPLTGSVSDINQIDAYLKRYNDRVDRGELAGARKYFPDEPDPWYTARDGTKHYFSNEQATTLYRESGTLFKERVLAMDLSDPPTEKQVERIRQARAKATQIVRRQLLREIDR